MSLTEAERVFGGVHEDALNDFIRAFCQARPRYLRYGSPAFVPATTVDATAMPSIAFPGIPGGIDWTVSFEIPSVDLHTQTMALPPELSLGPGQFGVRTAVELCVDCRHRRDPPKEPGKKGRGNDDRDHDDRRDDDDRRRPPKVEEAICAVIGVFAVGHIEPVSGPGGARSIRLRIDAVELVDVTPDGLEAVLECLIRMLLDAALRPMVLPLDALRAGAFTLTPLRGPDVEDDQIKIYGDV
jgi:hypothetical protein